jgi:hypothetical protein
VKIRRVLASASIATALAVAGGGIAATTANASTGFADLETTTWLSNAPTLSMPEICISKSIWLTAADYFWSVDLWDSVPGGFNESEISIASAMYKWSDCLIPEDGYYLQVSTLSGPWGIATVTSGEQFFYSPSGQHQWGSILYY